MQQKREREKILKMKEERRRQAAREKLGKDQQQQQQQQGLQSQDQETKEQKQSRQVILHKIEDQLDERTLKVAFEKYVIEVSVFGWTSAEDRGFVEWLMNSFSRKFIHEPLERGVASVNCGGLDFRERCKGFAKGVQTRGFSLAIVSERSQERTVVVL